MVPVKRVFMMCVQANDWLYPAIMKDLRDRFGTTFFLVCADDRLPYFKSFCADGDKICTVREFGPFQIERCDEQSEKVFETAREYEEKYSLTYLRDIIQQDRTISTRLLGFAPNTVFDSFAVPPLVDIVNHVSRCFDFHEQLLEREQFDLVLNRPGGLSETVMAEVATRRGVPVTFFHGSYFGKGAQWSGGPYLGSAVIRQRFEETSKTDPVPFDQIAPGAWSPPPRPKLRDLILNLVKMTVTYGQFAIEDLRARKRARRMPFVPNMLSQISQFRVRRYLDRICETSISKIAQSPFIYVALPDEPEFTVQSMCREFADSNAWFRQLALSAPAGVTIVFKEHQRIGHRSKEFYDRFRRMPNVVFAHPGLRGIDLIARCAATATMGGSTPTEAALFGKPSIVFGTRNPYSFLPSVYIVSDPAELAGTLRQVLSPRSESVLDQDKRDAARFRAAVQSLSFDAAGTKLFYGGTGTGIESGEVTKAVDALIYSATTQRQIYGRQRSEVTLRTE